MVGQYSHKHFFRHVPNHQLAEYFNAKAVELSVDLSTLKEKEVDAIFIAFTALPEDQQATIRLIYLILIRIVCVTPWLLWGKHFASHLKSLNHGVKT